MVLQETFGEFDSTQRLRSLIELICQLPGTYEVLIKSDTGEEGILHCANETIKNAACRNLSGIEALNEILAWTKGKYWLDELPVLPVRTINLPLEKLFTEIDDAGEVKADKKPEKESAKPGLSPEEKPEPVARDRQNQGSLTEVIEGNKPDVIEEVEKQKTLTAEESSAEEKEALTAEKSADGSAGNQVKETVTEPVPTKIAETETEPLSSPTIPDSQDANGVKEDLAHRIAAIKGAVGVLVTSVDGMLLSAVDMEATEEQAQMIATLGEALEQMGESFSKGNLLHGALDLSSERILIHSLRKSYVATFIESKASAAMVGGEIEELIKKESGK